MFKKVFNDLFKIEAYKAMNNLAIQNFDLPGDKDFPLNSMYQKPKNKMEEDTMRLYMTQLRQETGLRLIEKAYDRESGRLSKWWACFYKKKFMEKSLSRPGM